MPRAKEAQRSPPGLFGRRLLESGEMNRAADQRTHREIAKLSIPEGGDDAHECLV